MYAYCTLFVFFFFKQKTAYEMRISDWSSDVCSSDLDAALRIAIGAANRQVAAEHFDEETMVDAYENLYARALHGYGPFSGRWKIGRASCRERVCQYV